MRGKNFRKEIRKKKDRKSKKTMRFLRSEKEKGKEKCLHELNSRGGDWCF